MPGRTILFLILQVIPLVSFPQARSLEYYLGKASENNPQINEYRNLALTAISDSILVNSSRKPLIEGNTLLQYSPYSRNFGYDEAITDGGNYTVTGGISQSIFNGKEYQNRYSSAAITRRASENNARIAEKELKKMITDQYLTAFSDQSDLNFNLGFLKLYQDELAIAESFVSAGTWKQTDYLSLVIESRTQAILVKELRNRYRKDIMLLHRICNLNDTATYELAEPQISPEELPGLARDPGFNRFMFDSLRIENEKQAIDIRYRPKVKWFADAGLMTSNPWNFYRHFGVSAGLSLNVPIYDGNQRNVEKGKLAYEENSRSAYRQNYINLYRVNITELQEDLRSFDTIMEELDKQLVSAESLVSALKNELNTGIAEMTEYINAVRNLRSAAHDLNMVKIRKMQTINEMNFLLIK
ncbi:MAG TPA: TolC family protein [Bacteroidales bacterium]|nr:TolC family protein [Bacteroidales bacterium]